MPPGKRMVRSLEDELLGLDDCIDQTATHRRMLTERALDMASRVQLEGMELLDPKAVTAATTLLTTAMRALNDTEASASRAVNAKLKLADQTRQDEMSGQVIDLFRKMASGSLGDAPTPPISLDDTSAELTDQFLRDGGEILTTELKSDPYDIPQM